MAAGTVRTITKTVTVPANGSKTFSKIATPLPAAHLIQGFVVDDPGVDIVLVAINGLVKHPCIVKEGDKVSVVLSNETAGSISVTMTITIVELGFGPPQ
jgi:hypothetical protein